jgi:hypothetical protein
MTKGAPAREAAPEPLRFSPITPRPSPLAPRPSPLAPRLPPLAPLHVVLARAADLAHQMPAAGQIGQMHQHIDVRAAHRRRQSPPLRVGAPAHHVAVQAAADRAGKQRAEFRRVLAVQRVEQQIRNKLLQRAPGPFLAVLRPAAFIDEIVPGMGEAPEAPGRVEHLRLLFRAAGGRRDALAQFQRLRLLGHLVGCAHVVGHIVSG